MATPLTTAQGALPMAGQGLRRRRQRTAAGPQTTIQQPQAAQWMQRTAPYSATTNQPLQAGPAAPRSPAPTLSATAQPQTYAAGATVGGAPVPATLTSFGPTNDLRATQINPTTPGYTQNAQDLALQAIRRAAGLGTAPAPGVGAATGLAGTALENVFNTPDRAQLAADALRLFEEQQADERRIGMRDIGREAAKLGRIGSGVTTSQLGDLGLRLGRERQQMERALATEAAGQTLADQIARLSAATGTAGALSGLQSEAVQRALAPTSGALAAGQQAFGQGQAGRQELRGERTFQQAQAQQALQDYLNMIQASEALTQGQFTRERQRLQDILGTGFGGAAGEGASTLISGVGKFPEAEPIDWAKIGSSIGGIFE